ncbi:low molecular weight protein tyrosine phosphatase family protein [Iodobacter arcticus]|uniref:Low molecular weight protein tyrosine phosphatase family protein n=1 Tax=Iodobacter arcticus TaxID=590593 RepID=A0ABW2R6K4_9NEIS
MIRALFICSRNRLRSPTAEQVFSIWQGVETDSAGLASDADMPLSSEQIDWATHIFVMEKIHQRRLNQRFAAAIKNKKIICLNIPDDYQYMQTELINLLEKKAAGHLGG